MNGGIGSATSRSGAADRLVLQRRLLRAPRGHVLALVGASGSGKSTLLRCLNRLAEPESGTIALDGEDIRRARAARAAPARRRSSPRRR